MRGQGAMMHVWRLVLSSEGEGLAGQQHYPVPTNVSSFILAKWNRIFLIRQPIGYLTKAQSSLRVPPIHCCQTQQIH
jgi:hypothetical protein